MRKDLKIIDRFNRKKLIEGRDYGIGMAFLTPKNYMLQKGISFRAMQAFSCCKDYLNDVVYVEETTKPLKKIYGFKHKYTGLFRKKTYVYLGVRALHYNSTPLKKWNKFDEATKLLQENYINLERAINALEAHLKLSNGRTTIKGISGDVLILKVPRVWVKKGFLISLYTLFIRNFFNISEKTSKLEIIKMVTTQKNSLFTKNDSYLHKEIEKFLERKNYKQYLKTDYLKVFEVPREIHNGGISGFNQYLLKNELKK